jgi:peptidoglycan hydrolase CwlO-like protein
MKGGVTMIVFSDEERKNMIERIKLEDNEILNLEKEREKAQEKLDVLDSKIGMIEERKEAVMAAYGLSFNYVKGHYQLDDTY